MLGRSVEKDKPEHAPKPRELVLDQCATAGPTASTCTAQFTLGRCVSTPAALLAMALARVNTTTLLRRHAAGDWGDLGEDDLKANDAAVNDGTRILSSYDLSSGRKVWVITEADRSVTTFLLPNEY